MKKLIALALVILSMMTLTCAALAENNAAMYRELLDAKEEWTCIYHSCYYYKNNNPYSSIHPDKWIVFGDQTGEVWMVKRANGGGRIFRMWFTDDGQLVLTFYFQGWQGHTEGENYALVFE